MVPTLLLFLSLGLLWLGAEGLVGGSSSLALRLGVAPLIVGLTIVAYGTSTPELIVSVQAALAGQGDIAVGNAVGSNIFNICVILGLSAIVFPLSVQVRLLRLDTPIMLASAGLLWLLLLDRAISRIEAFLLLAGILGYTLFNVQMARKESRGPAAEAEMAGPALASRRVRPVALDLGYIVGGLGLLILGSRFLVDSSVTLARHFGVSEAVIGLTIIAAGTSMPELATSVIAALRRQADIAIGNIIGSNIYNVLAILGAAGAVAPLRAPGVGGVDLGLMCVVSVLLLPLMRSGFSIKRWEGAVLLLVYLGYLGYLWP